MDIILLERIEKLGTIGDVVTVKDGYARNFLLPQKKALRANEANKKVSSGCPAITLLNGPALHAYLIELLTSLE